MTRNFLLAQLCRSILMVSVVAALAGPAVPLRAQTPTVVHVATVGIDAGAEVYYAKELGYFSEAGLDVDIEASPNGGAAAAAVAGNGVDIGYADMVSIASGFGKSVPFTVIAPAAIHEPSAPVNLLVVANDSPVRSAKDLNGKVVAGSGLGTISGFVPREWLERNGADLASVKFIELPFPQMLPALEAGRIDAAMIAEPFYTAAKGKVRVLASPYDVVANGKPFLISAYFTTDAFASAHPDAVAKFAAAIRRAAVWANKNHAASADILLKYTKLDPSLAATMTRAYYGEQLTPQLLQPIIDIAAKYSKFPPFPAAKITYKGG
jgi:NitT/TauT family transport system substrate-binding protein